jgi:hypothetical protein
MGKDWDAKCPLHGKGTPIGNAILAKHSAKVLSNSATKAANPKEADGGGLRYNANKIRLDLIPPEWPWALGDVTTKGSYKYEERNWERGMKWSHMIGCVSRHILKFLIGERYDAETGCHHLAMAAWNILALMSYDLRGIGENNLPDSPRQPLKARNQVIFDLVNNGNPQHPKIREAMGLDKAA